MIRLKSIDLKSFAIFQVILMGIAGLFSWLFMMITMLISGTFSFFTFITLFFIMVPVQMIMGFFIGLLFSFLYNKSVKYYGGIKLDFEQI